MNNIVNPENSHAIPATALYRLKTLRNYLKESLGTGDSLTDEEKIELIAVSLLEEENRFLRLVEVLPLQLLRYDLNFKKFVFLNRDELWTGHTLDEWNKLDEKMRHGWIHPEDIGAYLETRRKWKREKYNGFIELEYRLRTKDEDYVWIESRMYSERSHSGEIISLVEIARDITERKDLTLELENSRMEVELGIEHYTKELVQVNEQMQREIDRYKRREQELYLKQEGFQNLITNSTDGILVTEPNGQVLYSNRRIRELTGYNREQLSKLSTKNLFDIAEHNRVYNRMEKRADGRNFPRPFKTEIICSNNEKKTIELCVSRIIWEGDLANVFTIRDIEDRRISEGKRISTHVRNAVHERYTFEGMVSKSTAMLRNFEILPTIADSESSILILGESGTGKELMVRAIHNLSPRRNNPLITVNSGALPDTLIESELFGYKKGAFTDAKTDKPGRFKMADGGTIFLDEIGEVSPAMQVKLLRVLQERTIEPLGSNESFKVDTRVIAATNKNLNEMVEAGSFRQDLFYRINVISLVMPPLRERKEDIPILAEHFIEKFNTLFGKDITSISPPAMGVLMNYEYPGNIRELENFIEHAFLLCRGEKILPEHLPDILTKYTSSDASLERPAETPDSTPIQPVNSETTVEPASVKQMEAQMIVASLERNRWNRTAAAEELGIHRVTLNRKIRSLNLKLPEIDGRSTYRNNH